MSAASAGGHDPSAAPGARWKEASSAPDTPPDRGLLEEVVRQTLAAEEENAARDRLIAECLREVRARHAGRPLTLDPVVLDLVDAVLEREFAGDGRRRAMWRGVSRQVAQTVYDDPACRQRLEGLWSRLGEE